MNASRKPRSEAAIERISDEHLYASFVRILAARFAHKHKLRRIQSIQQHIGEPLWFQSNERSKACVVLALGCGSVCRIVSWRKAQTPSPKQTQVPSPLSMTIERSAAWRKCIRNQRKASWIGGV